MQLFEDVLLPLAIKSGISVFQYWDMTIGEIYDVIEAYNYHLEEEVKKYYGLATMIAGFVGCVLDGKSIPSFNDIYHPHDDIEPEADKSLMLYKELWLDFANSRNKKLKELKVNDN